MKSHLAVFFMLFCLVRIVAQAPPTVEESLRAHHISTSSEDLRQALANSDPAVRGMAAVEIADKGDRTQIATLREALQKERDDNARLNFSRALKHLGDPDGRVGFEDACADRRMRPDLRIISADELSPDVGDKCFSALVDILFSSNSPVISQASLYALKRAKPSESAVEQGRGPLAHGLSRALDDSVMSVRKGAAETISYYKLKSVRSALTAALERENDSSVKAAMRASLRSLDSQSP